MANITSIEELDNTLANLKVLALKLDKDIAGTIAYIADYSLRNYEEVQKLKLINWNVNSEITDVEYNNVIEYLIHELQQVEEYETRCRTW